MPLRIEEKKARDDRRQSLVQNGLVRWPKKGAGKKAKKAKTGCFRIIDYPWNVWKRLSLFPWTTCRSTSDEKLSRFEAKTEGTSLRKACGNPGHMSGSRFFFAVPGSSNLFAHFHTWSLVVCRKLFFFTHGNFCARRIAHSYGRM